jgi:hypothetical protein
VDTLRRVRRTVAMGRKVSAKKHIVLLIHPVEERKEQ